MKKIVYSALILLMGTGLAFAQPASNESVASGDGPQFSFEEMEYDFGDITQGDVVEHVFKFKNTGNSALIINNVLTTCGCTAPEWPKEPILAGESGEIKVRFNSAHKNGRQNKIITIQSNVEGGTTRLKIVSMVLPKKEGEASAN